MRRRGMRSIPNFQWSMVDVSCYRKLYDRLDYSIADIEEAVGASIALSDDRTQVIMGRMRQSSLSIHGIEGAFYGSGAKTVIPAKVTGKFSIRFAIFSPGKAGKSNDIFVSTDWFLPKLPTTLFLL